ncbi:alpha-L-fucosidase [Trueperella pyogenes]|uniref:alpha-L-fucosidase n=1 Tax=Trueperella pyogenes TaxID=1661 RepID=UPI0024C0119B|nr:alpha-L-fucosidase [Trueperella pyogenes]WHU57778.1 alpha-L-fucosidase [Trueperella pyogenes]
MDNVFENRTGPAHLAATTVYPKHEVPGWFDAAKLGFFIHLGIYSVPAWAYRRQPGQVTPPELAYDYHEYAEWYANTVRIPGSPCARWHEETFGVGVSYEDLAARLTPSPAALGDLVDKLVAAGGKYIVPTTKHHDGFCLWDTATTPFSSVARGGGDVISAIADAVRATDARLGLYFSGALDWHVSHFAPIRSDDDLFSLRRNDEAFARYAAAQLSELIDRYHPDLLWNDIEWPDAGKGADEWGLAAILGRYLAAHPEATINDRWGIPFHGYLTREYTHVDEPLPEKWESTRGLNRSFGYNRHDDPADRLSGPDVTWLLVDVVSHGGNLLLNVGPRADGTLDPYQDQVVAELGEWMAVYGDYIYASSPGPVPYSLTTPGATAYFVRPGDSAQAADLVSEPRCAWWLAPDGRRTPATRPAPTASFPFALIVER